MRRAAIILSLVSTLGLSCDRDSERAATATPATPYPATSPSATPSTKPTEPAPPPEKTAEQKATELFPNFARSFDQSYRECVAEHARAQKKLSSLDMTFELGEGYASDVRKTDSLLHPVIGEVRIPVSSTTRAAVPGAGYYSNTSSKGHVIVDFELVGGRWRIVSAKDSGTEKRLTIYANRPLIDSGREKEQTEAYDIDLLKDEMVRQATVRANARLAQ